jgi:hypothetical protein
MRRRVTLLLLLFPVYVAVMAWVNAAAILLLMTSSGEDFIQALDLLVTPSHWELDTPALWLLFFAPATVLAATQFMFILPLIRVRQPRGGHARSLRASLIAAALVAAVLTGGLGFGMVSATWLVLEAYIGANNLEWIELSEEFVLAILATVPVSWVVWSWVLLRFARRKQGRGVLSRVIGLLLAGTIVEVLVVLPVDIMVRRRTDCYCEPGSFWTLWMSAWALLWLSGPGAFLMLRRTRRHPWWETHCEACGYEKGPSPGRLCPECGHAWEETRQPPPQQRIA